MHSNSFALELSGTLGVGWKPWSWVEPSELVLDGRKEGQTEGRTQGLAGGVKAGRTDGRRDGRKTRRKAGRTEAALFNRS